MKTKLIGFLVGVSQLAVCALASDPVPSAPPLAQGPVAREIGNTFAYELPTPTQTPPVVVTPAATALPTEPDATLLQLPAYQVKDVTAHIFRDLNAAFAQQKLNAPCDLIVEDIGPSLQFRAFGPPAPPMPAETHEEDHQVRIPLVSLTW